LARRHIARIDRAVIPIVAELRLPQAGTIGARIVERTGLAIVARSRIPDLETSEFGVTDIVRADASIATIRRRASLTALRSADIIRRAGIVVVARKGIRGKHTSGLGIADILGAAVAIITRESPAPRGACGSDACIVQRADIPILARRLVRKMNAAHQRITARVRAGISILTLLCQIPRPRDAFAVPTGIPHGTGIPILARDLIRRVHAALTDDACIIRAPIVVVTHQKFIP